MYFLIKERNLRKATLEYQYSQKKIPFFYFCLEAKDELGKNFAFEYELNMGMKELYALPLKPNNINSYVSIGETFFYNPYLDRICMLDFSLEDNMYHDVPSYWVMKLESDCFIFKVSIPEEQIFIWFQVDFHNVIFF